MEAKSKLEEFEKEQQRVVALEDFETADKINEAIEDMKKQVSDLNNSTISMKATVINLEEQKLTNRRKQVCPRADSFQFSSLSLTCCISLD